MGILDPCGPAYVEHQAEMIAAALPLPEPDPGPWASRDDLTVFAALLARLGGEAVVTWAEAQRVTGVHVTRWDEPANMRYRFTLDAPETPDTPADIVHGTTPEGLLHESDHAIWCSGHAHFGPCRRGRRIGTERQAGQ